MFVKEAIKSYPALEDVSSVLLEKACTDRSLNADTDYVASFRQTTELVAADLMVEVANSPDFTEGDLSIKYSREYLIERAKQIYTRYNDPALNMLNANVPKISDKSNVW